MSVKGEMPDLYEDVEGALKLLKQMMPQQKNIQDRASLAFVFTTLTQCRRRLSFLETEVSAFPKGKPSNAP